MHTFHRERRTAVTLIEVLVVIAIIALLAALLLPAVMVIWREKNVRADRIELGRLDAALKDFKAVYKRFPPSIVKLCENEAEYGTTDLDMDSRALIHEMFPRLPNPWVGVDWNGNGSYDPPVILYGDQCLVFFLGGPPLPQSAGGPTVKGFSEDTSNPLAQDGKRIRYYNFRSARLFDRLGNGFYSYYDNFQKQPFAYFSGYKAPNGYSPARFGKTGYPVDECRGLGFAGKDLYPYQSSPGVYLNPNTFQIICAGADGNFGIGSNTTLTPVPYWTATTATSMYSMLPPGEKAVYQDDQANFAISKLQSFP